MSLKMADAGLNEVLAECASTWNSSHLKLHLFKSNTTPTTSSVIGDFTESTFSGYAAQNINTWPAGTVSAHVSTMQAAPNTFTRSSTGTSENVYGYYVTDPTSSTLFWAERDPNAPIALTNAGDSYTVTPSLSQQDLST